MKAAVILSGSGVYDGSEIHEAVFTLLALDVEDVEYQCFAPDKNQLHVVNHLDGSEMQETRNVLIESARIARGNVLPLDQFETDGYDLIVVPGGFGAAKNLNQWAIKGADGDIDENVKSALIAMKNEGKVICGLCMGPTVIAQALKGQGDSIKITVGSTIAPSPYDIAGINEGLSSIGAQPQNSSIEEVTIDKVNKIVTAPCYMMDASIKEVRSNITKAIKEAVSLVK